MGTWNTAQTYGLAGVGCLEKGFDADIAVLDSLENMKVLEVYKKGIPSGRLLKDRAADYRITGELCTQ